MRRKHFIGLALLAGAILLFLYFTYISDPVKYQRADVRLESTNRSSKSLGKKLEELTTRDDSGGTLPDDMHSFVEAIRRDPTIEGKYPISFWGKVVDEMGRPVDDASVVFRWTELSPTGTSRLETKSDSNGMFSLLNRKGKGLTVDVAKQGYYNFPGSARASFEYANPAERFHPDPRKPIIFRLKKAGRFEPLIAYSVSLPVANDGKPTSFDLVAGRLAELGSIRFQCELGQSEETSGHYDWLFKVTIPTGGLILRTNTLDFEAPIDGYEQSYKVVVSTNDERWHAQFVGSFFVKSGSPTKYARVDLKLTTQRKEYYQNSSVHMKCWVNPSDTRNLEADPSQSLKIISRDYLKRGLPPDTQ